MATQDEFFEKLSEKREASANVIDDPSMRGIKDSVVEKYSEQAHFIYELLQNADDCGAKKARFVLEPSHLVFAHNGVRNFSVTDPKHEEEKQGDINAITSIGNSNKRDSKNKIGKFGVGFKAVFTYTETPHIYDKNYKFLIERLIVPRRLEEDFAGRGKDETLFDLPFDRPDKSPETCYEAISSKLQNLSYPLLFLTHLKEIRYTIGGIDGYYRKEIEEARQFENVTAELICCTNVHGDTKNQDRLWLFTQSDEEGRQYSVGFFLGERDDGRTFLRPVDMPAFCFFPTKEATGLHFIIQAPFLLTDSREGIREDEPHNRVMLGLLADLAARSITFLKRIGEDRGNHLIDENILTIIPIRKIEYYRSYYGTNYGLKGNSYEHSYGIWDPFYESMKEVFRKEAIIPAKEGYASSSNAYWADESKIAELFSDAQLSQLYGKDGSKWVFPSISRNTHGIAQEDEARRTFIDFITEDKHPNEAEILDKITPSFIEGQPIIWLTDFYKWINESSSRRTKVKRLPVFLDQYHKAVAAFDKNGQEILFTPSANIDEDEYPTLSKDLWNIEDLREFFKNLELGAPSTRDYIYNKILPLYKDSEADSISVEKADEHFKLFFDYYYCDHRDLGFIDLIKNCSFLTYCDSDGNWHRAKANELYLPTVELKKWFQLSPQTRFLSKEKYEKIVGKENWSMLEDFLESLGIKTEIAINYIERKPDTLENPEYRGTRYDIWLEPHVDGLKENIGLLRSKHLSSNELSKLVEQNGQKLPEGKREEYEEYLDGEKQSRKEKAKFLWDTLDRLLEQPAPSGSWQPPYPSPAFSYGSYRFPSGEHHWFYRHDQWETYESTLQHKLREIAWNFATENGYFNPESIDGSPSPKLLELFGISQESHEQKDERLLKVKEEAQELGIDPVEVLEKEIAKKKEEKARIEENIAAEEELRENADLSFSSDVPSDVSQNADLKKGEAPGTTRTDSLAAHSESPFQTLSSSSSRETATEDFTEGEDITLSPQSVSETIEKKQQKIQDEINKLEDEQERLKEMYARVSQLPKYSFGWFKALLSLEKEGQGQTPGGREISITFSSVTRDPKSDRSFILGRPNRYVPPSIEDKSNIPLSLFMQDGKKRSPEIEVVSVKGNTLRVKAKNGDQLKGINFSKVTHAVIDVKNPDFLLESLDGEFQKLDYSDDYDMQRELCENIEFLVGPPGTGKTTYLAEHLKTLMEGGGDSCKVLVLTPTNKAADVLVRKIMEISGEDDSYKAWLARIGMTEDEEIEDSPVFREKALDIQGMSKCVAVTTIARYPYDYLIPGKGKRLPLNEIDWDYIVVDEASMIPLADITFLLYKQKPKKFIIAGDPFQIEPIVSQEAWKDENIYSLVKLKSFKKLSTIPYLYEVQTLNTQYRSIPEIGEVFSNFAYEGKLEHHRTPSERKDFHLKDLDVKPLNIIKYPVRKYESIYRAKRLQNSPYQLYSALLTVEYILFLANKISESKPGQSATIGVISPYRAQAQIIDRLLSREKLPEGIKVTSGTVHKFQGDECDIIFAVFNAPANLSNPDNMHINKKNIINVAVSRARDYLFVVMPDDETENVENLRLIKRIENLMKKDGACSVTSAEDIEKMIFKRNGYLEDNVFSTGHQDVNVYDRPEKMYEVRTEEDAVDIQIHVGNNN